MIWRLLLLLLLCCAFTYSVCRVASRGLIQSWKELGVEKREREKEGGRMRDALTPLAALACPKAKGDANEEEEVFIRVNGMNSANELEFI